MLKTAFAVAIAFANLVACTNTQEMVAAANLLDNKLPDHALVSQINAGVMCCQYGAPFGAATASNQSGELFLKIMSIEPSVFNVANNSLAANHGFTATLFAQATVIKPTLVFPEDCRTQSFLQKIIANATASVLAGSVVVIENHSGQEMVVAKSFGEFDNFTASWPAGGKIYFRMQMPFAYSEHIFAANFSVKTEFLSKHWRATRRGCVYQGDTTSVFSQSTEEKQRIVFYLSPASAQAIAGKINGKNVLRVNASFSTPFDAMEVRTLGANYFFRRFSFPLSVIAGNYNFTRVNVVPAGSSSNAATWSNASVQADLPAGGNLAVSLLSPFGKKDFLLQPTVVQSVALNLSVNKTIVFPGQRVAVAAKAFNEHGVLAGKSINFSFLAVGNQSSYLSATNASGVATADFEMPASNVFVYASTLTELGEEKAFQPVLLANSRIGVLLDYAWGLLSGGFVVFGLLLAAGLREAGKSAMWFSVRAAVFLLAIAVLLSVFL